CAAYHSEEKDAQSRPECRGAPVHPAIGLRPHLEIVRPQASCRVLGGEITHDRIRLPEHEAIILDRRHQCVGVETEVMGCLHDTECPTRVDSLVLESHLLAAPQYFLNIDRIVPAPDNHQLPRDLKLKWEFRS